MDYRSSISPVGFPAVLTTMKDQVLKFNYA